MSLNEKNFGPSEAAGFGSGLGSVEYRTSNINPQEVEGVNRYFNLEAYGILHDTQLSADGRTSQEDVFPFLPEIEDVYDQTAEIVRTMDPSKGDMLFTEGDGHMGFRVDNDWSLLGRTPEEWLVPIEYARSVRLLGPWSYAVAMALVLGVPVVSADMHAAANTEFYRLMEEYGLDPKKAEYYRQIMREEQAANTVKDYAVDALPTIGDSKPTYRLIFGVGHFGDQPRDRERSRGIVTAYDRLGLAVNAIILPAVIKARELINRL